MNARELWKNCKIIPPPEGNCKLCLGHEIRICHLNNTGIKDSILQLFENYG